MICPGCDQQRDSRDITQYTGGTCIYCMDEVRDVARKLRNERYPVTSRHGPRPRRVVNWQESLHKRQQYERQRKPNRTRP